MDILKETPPQDNNEEERDELEDIILNKAEKGAKLKKIALMGGIAVLIILIGIIAVKYFSAEEEVTNNDFFVTETQPQQSENFEQIPIAKEEEKPKITETKKEEKTEEKNLTTKEEIVLPKKEEEIKKPAPQKPKEKEEKNIPKPVHKKAKPPKKVKKIPTKSLSLHYYVQVGAFYKYPPNNVLLDKIKRNGLKYKIKTFIQNGKKIKKVLIGPFATKAKAREKLYLVRRKIKKDAFLTKVKE